MSKAIHALLNNEGVVAGHSLEGIQGDFPFDEAVLEGGLCKLPKRPHADS